MFTSNFQRYALMVSAAFATASLSIPLYAVTTPKSSPAKVSQYDKQPDGLAYIDYIRSLFDQSAGFVNVSAEFEREHSDENTKRTFKSLFKKTDHKPEELKLKFRLSTSQGEVREVLVSCLPIEKTTKDDLKKMLEGIEYQYIYGMWTCQQWLNSKGHKGTYRRQNSDFEQTHESTVDQSPILYPQTFDLDETLNKRPLTVLVKTSEGKKERLCPVCVSPDKFETVANTMRELKGLPEHQPSQDKVEKQSDSGLGDALTMSSTRSAADSATEISRTTDSASSP